MMTIHLEVSYDKNEISAEDVIQTIKDAIEEAFEYSDHNEELIAINEYDPDMTPEEVANDKPASADDTPVS